MLVKEFVNRGDSSFYIILPRNFLRMLNIEPENESIVMYFRHKDIIVCKHSEQINFPHLKKKFMRNGNSFCLTIPSDVLKMNKIDPRKSKVGLNIEGSDIVIKILPKEETESNN